MYKRQDGRGAADFSHLLPGSELGQMARLCGVNALTPQELVRALVCEAHDCFVTCGEPLKYAQQIKDERLRWEEERKARDAKLEAS